MLSVTLFSLKSVTLLNEQEDKWYLFIQNCSQVCPLPCRKNMITRKRSQRIPENCSNMNIINNITPTTFPTVARLPIGKHLLVCNTRDTQFLDHPDLPWRLYLKNRCGHSVVIGLRVTCRWFKYCPWFSCMPGLHHTSACKPVLACRLLGI